MTAFALLPPGADMGALLFNDTDVTAGGRIYVDRGKDCTLLALPNSGCRFAGWQQGNKILSGDASYTFTPVASATYTPLFLDNSDRLTFLFIDPFSNVLSYQQVDSAAEVKIPTPPTYTGYTFGRLVLHADADPQRHRLPNRAGTVPRRWSQAADHHRPRLHLAVRQPNCPEPSDCCLWGAGYCVCGRCQGLFSRWAGAGLWQPVQLLRRCRFGAGEAHR